jgi:hypothetical protein
MATCNMTDWDDTNIRAPSRTSTRDTKTSSEVLHFHGNHMKNDSCDEDETHIVFQNIQK